MNESELQRCRWVPAGDDLYRAYHDEEWGKPLTDDLRLFELLVLETFQAGLSWRLILGRRESFRSAFAGFNPEAIAAWTDEDIGRLMQDAGIIRNRQKLEATRGNARAYLSIVAAHGSFSDWLWSLVPGAPLIGHWEKQEDIPARTPLSDAVSKTLKKNGFKFVGSVTVYAFMQAAGLVQDHLTGCYRYGELVAP